MAKKPNLPKPRNPFVQHLKRGGAHGKSTKAMRAQSKRELKKEIRNENT